MIPWVSSAANILKLVGKQKEATGAVFMNEWMKSLNVLISSVAAKKSLFVSGEFLLRYRAVRASTPIHPAHAVTLREWGIVGRDDINVLDRHSHKSNRLPGGIKASRWEEIVCVCVITACHKAMKCWWVYLTLHSQHQLHPPGDARDTAQLIQFLLFT